MILVELPLSYYKAERLSEPSEPRHSLDRAMPSYYTKSLELCKWNL
jgi:hypothetical protein